MDDFRLLTSRGVLGQLSNCNWDEWECKQTAFSRHCRIPRYRCYCMHYLPQPDQTSRRVETTRLALWRGAFAAKSIHVLWNKKVRELGWRIPAVEGNYLLTRPAQPQTKAFLPFWCALHSAGDWCNLGNWSTLRRWEKTTHKNERIQFSNICTNHFLSCCVAVYWQHITFHLIIQGAKNIRMSPWKR